MTHKSGADARGDLAREARALARDNAQDAVERVIRAQVAGVTHAEAWPLAEAVVTELASWFRQRSSPTLNGDPFILASEWAARLLEEFTP